MGRIDYRLIATSLAIALGLATPAISQTAGAGWAASATAQGAAELKLDPKQIPLVLNAKVAPLIASA